MPTVNDVVDLITTDAAGVYVLTHKIVVKEALSCGIDEELLEGLTDAEAVSLSNLLLLNASANAAGGSTWSITVSHRVAQLFLLVQMRKEDPDKDRLLNFVRDSYTALLRQAEEQAPLIDDLNRNQIGFRFTDRNETVYVTVVVGLILSRYSLERYEKALREIAADHGYNHFRVDKELLGVYAYHVGGR
jgi:hypothetical protein